MEKLIRLVLTTTIIPIEIFSRNSYISKRFTKLLGRFFHYCTACVQLFRSILSDFRCYIGRQLFW